MLAELKYHQWNMSENYLEKKVETNFQLIILLRWIKQSKI